LDVASGPIGLPEYLDLSRGFKFRICIDISIRALLHAEINLHKSGQKGFFICGDITAIPLMEGSMDAVLSQHTLYHLPKDEQSVAVREMYRVAKSKSKIVIIYCWFYHSWMMNLSLHIVQVYRIARHFAGKLYTRYFRKTPRLYFFAHSPQWFRRSFEFGEEIEFFSWRSANKYFLNLYIHRFLYGNRLLKWLQGIEEKKSKFMGTFGEYASILISKK